MLGLLGHTAEQIKPEIVERLTEAHMGQLEQAFEVRPETIEVLKWARQRYRIGMISNFAYAPTLYDALDRFGIRSAFEAVMVSVEVGWCKPHRLIFERTCEHMGIRASEALFVGDQLYLDVYGALNAGMDVAWIETGWQEWLLPNVPRPEATYRVRSILELINLLENR
jgi:putative hydrolase of the HAD superfamily